MHSLKKLKHKGSNTLRTPGTEVIVTNSAAATKSVGSRIAAKLKPGDVIYLEGELGGGKTTLVQGILKALGIKKAVRSSSFILVNEYTIKKNIPLFHIDLYRLPDSGIETLGLEEYINPESICIIEWADKIKGLMGTPSLKIKMTWLGDNKRKIEINQLSAIKI